MDEEGAHHDRGGRAPRDPPSVSRWIIAPPVGAVDVAFRGDEPARVARAEEVAAPSRPASPARTTRTTTRWAPAPASLPTAMPTAVPPRSGHRSGQRSSSPGRRGITRAGAFYPGCGPLAAPEHHLLEDLADREETDEHGDEVDAGLEERHAEGEALHPVLLLRPRSCRGRRPRRARCSVSVIEKGLSTETLARPNTTTAKNSTVEKPSAIRAKGGAKKARKSALTRPPKAELMIASPSAYWVLPWRLRRVALPRRGHVHGHRRGC